MNHQVLMKSDRTTDRTMMSERTASSIWLALILRVFLVCFLLLDIDLKTFLMFLESFAHHMLQLLKGDGFGHVAVSAGP